MRSRETNIRFIHTPAIVWGIFLIVVILFLVAMCGHSVFAASQKGLTVSPLRTELTVEPGRSVTKEMRVTNRSDQPIEVSMSAKVFKTVNDQYDYAFIDRQNDGGEPGDWVRFENRTFTLASNKSTLLRYQLAVPLKAEPGGRYISVFASTLASESTTNAEPSLQQVGSLLYVTVAGDVTRTGSLLGFTAPKVTTKDIAWSAQIRNSGSTHFRTKYVATVSSMFGMRVGEAAGDALILPGTVRLVSDTISIKTPGIYRIDYVLGLGDSPAHKYTMWVVYMPVYATVIAVISVGSLLLGGFSVYKRKKRRVH